MWKKNKNNVFNRSASLPTRSKNKPPIFGPSTSEDDTGLSPEERDKRIHAALKQIKELAISAKEKYKKERHKHRQTGAYLMDCQTLIETSIPNLKKLLGISTHEEQRAQEKFLAEEENFRHNTSRDLRKWNSGFNEKRRHEDELQNLHNSYGKKLENFQKEHESALRRLREMEKSVQSLEAEKENLLTRLSQVAGAKLRDNNPAISDLSDPNRPLKLIEKINELYDNEWTDAMENLETDTNEQMSIENLLKILQKCFGVCQHYAQHQLTTIRKAIELDEKFRPDPILVGKCAKDMQKSVSTWMLTDSSLLVIVWNHVSNSVGQIAERCRPFVNKCVQYCWLMCIQDPPIHMSTFNRGEEYNSNEMKSFTKTGRFVDFVVWPAFYLYENGPLLSKAIIQGTNQFSQGQGKDQYRRRDNVEISNKQIKGAQITQPQKTGTPNEYSPQNIIDRANPRTLTHEREMRPMDGMPSIESTERNGKQNDQNFTHVPSKSGEYRPFYSPNPNHEKRREPQRERTNNYHMGGVPATVYRDTRWYANHANSPHFDAYGTSQNHHSAISQQTGQRSTNTNQREQYVKHNETASRSNYYRQGHRQPFSKTYTDGSRTYKSTEL